MQLNRTCTLSVRKRSFVIFAGLCLSLMLCYFIIGTQIHEPGGKNCTGYFELRSVNFLQDSMRNRLCDNVTAFTIVDARFPLCQLPQSLPDQIEHEVSRQAVRDFVTNQVTGRNVTIYRYHGLDFVSLAIAEKHSWEKPLVSRLLKIMQALSASDVTFLDIGSNIGVYSLQVADAGIATIAVDANIRNLVRMQLSARHLQQPPDRLRLFWAFFDTQVSIKYLEFDAEHCNIGGGSGSGNQHSVIADTIPVATAIGDDLVPHVKTRFVVMKIDVESSERVFFETSKKLIDKHQIAVVQMEWWRRSIHDSAATSPNHRYLVDFFTRRNYVLMSPIKLERLNPETFRDWDTIWVRWDFVDTVMKTL